MKIENHYSEVDLYTSNHFNTCWTKIDPLEPTFHDVLEDPGFSYSHSVALIAGILHTFESIGGSILNFLIILVVLRSKNIREENLTPSILSIAITDLIFSVYVIPVSAVTFFIRDVPFPEACTITAFTSHALWILSALNRLGISVFRCFAVLFPMKTKHKILKYVCRTLPLFGWLISILSVLPTFFRQYGRFGLECRSFMCRLIDVDTEGNPTEFNPRHMYFIIIAGTGSTIILLNVLLFSQVSYYSKNMLNQVNEINKDIGNLMLKNEKKAGKMVTIVSMSFLIVYCPIFIFIGLDEHVAATNETFMVVAVILVYGLVVVDPLAYIFFNDKYHKEIKITMNEMISLIGSVFGALSNKEENG